MSEITWKKYEVADMDSVILLHLETEKACGMHLDFPDLLEKPIIEAWVAKQDGKIIGGFYIEAVAEMCFFGRSYEVTRAARKFGVEEYFPGSARVKLGFRLCRMECPRMVGERDLKVIERELLLTGFQETDTLYKHFLYDLRG